jgi:hypothetical protein|tara:strand:+ start:145 stop:954 length:810 start_codon:yes stop_codon:yes gene_type:complete
MSYASGKNAYGISDRSGRRYRLKEMRLEWTGSLVGPDEFEPKHPQLFPPKAFPDPQALRNPRPEQNLASERAVQTGYNPVGFRDIPGITPRNNLVAEGGVGSVTIGLSDTGNESTSVTGVVGTASVGSVTVTTPANDVTVNLTGIAGTGTVGSIVYVLSETFAVTVSNPGSGNRYYIDGVLQATVTLTEGRTYRFDQSHNTNSGHPLRFSTTSNGTHGGGSEYTTGVVTEGTPGNAGAFTQITVANSAPTLYYYCTNHSNMGGQANTPA